MKSRKNRPLAPTQPPDQSLEASLAKPCLVLKEPEPEWLAATALRQLPPIAIPADWEQCSAGELRSALARIRDRRILLAYPESHSCFDLMVLEAVERARVLFDAAHGQLESKVINQTTSSEITARIGVCTAAEYEALRDAIKAESVRIDADARARLEPLFVAEICKGRSLPLREIFARILTGIRTKTRAAYWREYQRNREMRVRLVVLAKDGGSGMMPTFLGEPDEPLILHEKELNLRVVFADEASSADKRAAQNRPDKCVILEPPQDSQIIAEDILHAAFRVERFCFWNGIPELVKLRQQQAGGRRTGALKVQERLEALRNDAKEAAPDFLKLDRKGVANLQKISKLRWKNSPVHKRGR